jgi:rhodanese-related sulfurtransferase
MRRFPSAIFKSFVEEVVLMSTIKMFSRLSLTLLFVVWSAVSMAQATDISQADLMQRIKTNHAGLILDVRSPEEYVEGHVPGAINIPYDQLDSRLAEISSHKNKEIVLYCKSGRRTGIAVNTLQAAGFSKLRHLDGDMDGWISKGDLPIKK